MKKINLLFTLLCMITMVFFITSRASAVTITITPGTDDQVIVDLSLLDLLYKAEVDGGEEGPYASSYETEFYNSSTDPSEALILYNDGTTPISGNPLYLHVKDGEAHIPPNYTFDLLNLHNVSVDYNDDGTIDEVLVNYAWNGTDNLYLDGFWEIRGAISHVAIYGTAQVPEPATMLLLGSGLIGLWIVRRKFKK